MTTTASFTPCCKSALRRRLERHLRVILLAAFGLLALARAQAAEIAVMQAERTADGVVVSALMSFELPPLVEEALQKGIPMVFVAEAQVLRDRWYWYDREVAGATRHMRLSYQPLTRRWRLLVAAGPISNTGLALAQTFDTRDDALAAVQRIAGWRVAGPGEVEGDIRPYTISLRFRLDVSQLPRPFQIGSVGQADWSLAATRTQRLSEAAR